MRLNGYDPARRRERENVRAQVHLRDFNLCRYCGVQTIAAVSGQVVQTKLLRTIDHTVPKSQGGAWTVSNCVTACFPCNNRKGDRTPEQAEMPLLSLAEVRRLAATKTA